MSIITSKQYKKHDIVDPIFTLFLTALFVLAIFAVSMGDIPHLVEDVMGSFDNAPAWVSVSNVPSFAADQRYWEAYCYGGWSSDSACDAIVARTQSCRENVDSAYCSSYKNYLQWASK